MTAESVDDSSTTDAAPSDDDTPSRCAFDPLTMIEVVRSVLNRLRDHDSVDPVTGAVATSAWRDYIHSHEYEDDAPFLSVIMTVLTATPDQVRDALVALDAQSTEDFELVIVTASPSSDITAKVHELLTPFASGLARRSRVVEGPSLPTTTNVASASTRDAALEAAFAVATGRYVTILDATSLVFGHFVETFMGLATSSPAAVVRARALTQSFRAVTWPSGALGYEPTNGATRASAPNFSVLEHLWHLEHLGVTGALGSPQGSYVILRRYVEVLGIPGGVQQLLAEAAILGGVCDASDDVVVLLRDFHEVAAPSPPR